MKVHPRTLRRTLRMPLRRKRILVAVGIIVGVLLITGTAAMVFVEPRAAIMRALFDAGESESVEQGFAAIAATVTVTRDLRVPVTGESDAALDVYQPTAPDTTARPMVMLVHGGGFISGDKRAIANYATRLAAEGFVVASLGYTLAPEALYPTPIRQANAALRYFASEADRFGGDATRVFVGGDSAGAQIASQTAAIQTNPTLAAEMSLTPAIEASSLRGALLFCGLYNMSTVRETGFGGLDTFMSTYLGQHDWVDAPNITQLSTTEQVTAEYPATLLVVGDADPFESQAFELQDALTDVGVDVSTQYWTGSGKNLGHEYQYHFELPEAHQSFAATLEFLRRQAR